MLTEIKLVQIKIPSNYIKFVKTSNQFNLPSTHKIIKLNQVKTTGTFFYN